MRQSFGLDEPGLAGLFAVVSLSAIGAFLLARLADRVARHRLLSWCFALTALAALGAASATELWLFAAAEILMLSAAGASVATAVILLSEHLPARRRAGGQGLGGAAVGLGAGACILVMPLLDATQLSWRALLWLAGGGLLAWPFLELVLRKGAGEPPAGGGGVVAPGLFDPPLRHRAVALLASGFLSALVVTTGSAWRYYHALSVAEIEPLVASAMLIVSSGLGIAGFFIGARMAERFGRVPTVVVSAAAMSAALVWYYWGADVVSGNPIPSLFGGLLVFALAGNALAVGGNCVATEWLPAPVRGQLMGWLMLVGALAQLAAQSAVALLSGPMAGISSVVAALACLGVGVSWIYARHVEETLGREETAN
jgi:MFS family permease